MDCRMVDSNIVVRDDCIVSVSPNLLSIKKKKMRYYGTVVRLVHNDQAGMKWHKDNSGHWNTWSFETGNNSPIMRRNWKEENKFEIHIKLMNVLEEEDNIQFQSETVA